MKQTHFMNRPPFDLEETLYQAVHHHRSGELDRARRLYEKILEIFPEHADALNLLGVIAHQTGNHDKAVQSISKAIRIEPLIPHFYNNLGESLKGRGNLDAAISSYRKALTLQEDFPEVYANMGDCFAAQGKAFRAISCYRKALQQNPDRPEWHCYLGDLYRVQGRTEAAIEAFEKALDIFPEYFDATYNLGMALKENRSLDEAVLCFKRAIQLNPDSFEACNSLGIVLKEQGKLAEAGVCYRKALELAPGFYGIYNNLGNLSKEQGKTEDAIGFYKKALQINPVSTNALNQLFRELGNACSWEELKELTTEMEALNEKAFLTGEKCAEMPQLNVTRCADPAQNLAAARSWSRDIEKSIAGSIINFSFNRRKPFQQPITIGYLSNDFRDHATSHLMCSLFGLHNRKDFRIFCYSYGPNDGSFYRKRIEQESDRFVDIRHVSDREAAKKIHNDQVHLLVDLMGHVGKSRLAICAYRPAPVQIAYLGYPGSTGAAFFDYMIADRIVVPKVQEIFYDEKIVFLPNSYQVNDHLQAIADRAVQKEDVGLPGDGLVFCSFSDTYKMEPVLFDAWMSVLRQVSKSVLWLLGGNPLAKDNLKREAASRGVHPDRLIFAEKLSKPEHLSRLKCADLALDTRICNGHTTTSDALWAGIPVIAIQGTHFASRVSSSLLHAVGLPELITQSLEEYQALAVRLAKNPEELKALKKKLEKNRVTEPLFDTPRFVKNLERAYKEIWNIYMAGEEPRTVHVSER